MYVTLNAQKDIMREIILKLILVMDFAVFVMLHVVLVSVLVLYNVQLVIMVLCY